MIDVVRQTFHIMQNFRKKTWNYIQYFYHYLAAKPTSMIEFVRENCKTSKMKLLEFEITLACNIIYQRRLKLV